MDHDDLELDDPTLKGAVQRAWGDGRAPQRLRARISHLIATAGSVDDSIDRTRRTDWERWRGRAYGLIAAAVLLFAVGWLTMYYQGFFTSPAVAGGTSGPVIHVAKVDVPITLARSMLATHANCGMHDHHIVDALTEQNYAALSVKLTADLGFPALARSIGTDWTFLGAGECDVAGNIGSHLLFARGEEKVSVFTLPQHCTGVGPGGRYEGMVEQHPVAGFARPGALYTVVGSSPNNSLTLETVMSIRDSLYAMLDVSSCTSEEGTLGF